MTRPAAPHTGARLRLLRQTLAIGVLACWCSLAWATGCNIYADRVPVYDLTKGTPPRIRVVIARRATQSDSYQWEGETTRGLDLPSPLCLPTNVLVANGMRAELGQGDQYLDLTSATLERDAVESAFFCMFDSHGWNAGLESVAWPPDCDPLLGPYQLLLGRRDFTQGFSDKPLEMTVRTALDFLSPKQDNATASSDRLWHDRATPTKIVELGVRTTFLPGSAAISPVRQPVVEFDVRNCDPDAFDDLQFAVARTALCFMSQFWGQPMLRPLIRVRCNPSDELEWRPIEDLFNDSPLSKVTTGPCPTSQRGVGVSRLLGVPVLDWCRNLDEWPGKLYIPLDGGETGDCISGVEAVPVPCGLQAQGLLDSMVTTDGLEWPRGFSANYLGGGAVDIRETTEPDGKRTVHVGFHRTHDLYEQPSDFRIRRTFPDLAVFPILLNCGKTRPRFVLSGDTTQQAYLKEYEALLNATLDDGGGQPCFFPILAGCSYDDEVRSWLWQISDGTYPPEEDKRAGLHFGAAGRYAGAIADLGITVAVEPPGLLRGEPRDRNDTAPLLTIDLSKAKSRSRRDRAVVREAVESLALSFAMLVSRTDQETCAMERRIKIVCRPDDRPIWEPYEKLMSREEAKVPGRK